MLDQDSGLSAILGGGRGNSALIVRLQREVSALKASNKELNDQFLETQLAESKKSEEITRMQQQLDQAKASLNTKGAEEYRTTELLQSSTQKHPQHAHGKTGEGATPSGAQNSNSSRSEIRQGAKTAERQSTDHQNNSTREADREGSQTHMHVDSYQQELHFIFDENLSRTHDLKHDNTAILQRGAGDIIRSDDQKVPSSEERVVEGQVQDSITQSPHQQQRYSDEQDREKNRVLQRKVTDLTGQVNVLDKRVSLLKQENQTLKKKTDEQKPAEEKIKNLKKRNAELAAIARRLEEKAKQLQNENSKRRSVSSVSSSTQDPEQLRKTFAKQRAKELTDHAKSIMMKDRMIEVLQQKCQELAEKYQSSQANGYKNQEQTELEGLIKQAARDRLRLERQVTSHQDVNSSEQINQKEAECEALQQQLEDAKLRCESLEDELRDVVGKSTQLTVRNIDLEAQLQSTEKLTEEVNSLKNALLQSRKECHGSQSERDNLQFKVTSLEDQLQQMKDIQERKKQLEADQRETLQRLRQKEHELGMLSQEKDDIQKADQDTISDLQAKLGELEKKYELQALKHHELTAEIDELRKETEMAKFRPYKHSTMVQKELEADALLEPSPSNSIHDTSSGSGGGDRRKEDMGAKLNNKINQLDSDFSVGLSVSRKLPFSVYVAKYSYDPVQNSPNENPEAELVLSTGDYIFVYGSPDEDGFYEGELMDGRRGLVPSNFVEKVPDEELEDFHSSLGLTVPDQPTLDLSATHDDYHFNSSDESEGMGAGFSGIPDAPIDVQVEKGPKEGCLTVSWLPVTISTVGTSNRASVKGYNVYIQGALVKSLQNPTGDHVVLDKSIVSGLHPEKCQLTVRTQALQLESVDSHQVSLSTHLVVKEAKVVEQKPKGPGIEPVPASSSELSDITEVDEEEDMPKKHHHHALRLESRSHDKSAISPVSPSFDHYSPCASPPQPISPTTAQVPMGRLVEGGPAHSPRGNGFLPVDHGPTGKYRNHAETAQWVQNRSGGGPVYTHMTVPHIEITKDSSGSLSGSGPENYSDEDEMNGHSSTSAISSQQPSPVISTSRPINEVPGHSRPYRPEGQAQTKAQIHQASGHPPYQSSPQYRNHGANYSDSNNFYHDAEIHSHGSNRKDKSFSDRHVAKMNEINQEQSSRVSSGRSRDGSRPTSGKSQDRKSSHTPDGRVPDQGSHSKRRDYFDGEGSQTPTFDDESSYSQLEDNNVLTSKKIRDDIPLSDLIDYEDDGGDSLVESIEMDYDGTSSRVRIFIALFDYDPLTMSPNPDAIEEELAFKEGQLIKIYGEKDADGFFLGEAQGRQGFVPCNMVSEVEVDDPDIEAQLLRESGRSLSQASKSASRGTTPRTAGSRPTSRSVSANSPRRRSAGQDHMDKRDSRPNSHIAPSPMDGTVKHMVAIYDYDPHALSPNVDSELELSFKSGDPITVYGDMDEDGFYYGELHGQRGLVPSNFMEEVSAPTPSHHDGYRRHTSHSQNTPRHSDPDLSRERERDRNRDRDRSHDRDRSRDRSREHSRDERDKNRERDRERDRDRDRERDRERAYGKNVMNARDNGASPHVSRESSESAANDKSVGFAPPRPKPPAPSATRLTSPGSAGKPPPSLSQAASPPAVTRPPPPQKEKVTPSVSESPPPSPVHVINMDINTGKKEKKGIIARGKNMFKKFGK